MPAQWVDGTQRGGQAWERNPAQRAHRSAERSSQEVGCWRETSRSQDVLPLCGDSSQRPSEGLPSLGSQDGDSGLDSGTERFPSIGEGVDQNAKPLIIGPEEDYDPGCLNSESDAVFQDLEKLKSRPAHLGVFLRYIFSQADPSPLLFYLCVEVYQQTNPKDSRSLGKDIWTIFLEKNAPLRVRVPPSVQAEIESRLRSGEDVRAALSEAQEAAMPEIQEQMQDYRTRRTLGLGSLYGENDLLELDGDPGRERHVAERQLDALGDILSKYEEDRSTTMALALNAYLSHAGIRLREARPSSTAEKAPSAPDKDKWLPFFPKTKKQSSNSKKDKDALEDRKRNPLLRYIGKPRSSSQSIKPGNVRNIIQHFENSQQQDGPEPGMQRLSTGSFPEDLLEGDSSRSEVRLGRSESLKGREELARSRKTDSVPRSRSDVDVDAAAEAARLHQSASSSASSLSTRSLENPTPPFTPKMGRRSVESPSLGFCTDVLLPHLLEDDLGQLSDLEPEPDTQNWQHTVGKDVVAGLSQREVDRQEVINELFVTEASHVRTLRVLDLVFYQRMRKESLLSREELARLFPNLPELMEAHNCWCEAMKKLRDEGPVIGEVGDLMLARVRCRPPPGTRPSPQRRWGGGEPGWSRQACDARAAVHSAQFDGPAREELQRVAAQFCSYQSAALELVKAKQRKDSRFQLFMQEAESHPQCRRLQLRDLIISEMQRLTKYPLLLESILKHTEGGTSEHEKLCRARDQCREILKYVNEAVKQTENRHRVEGYQKRLDTTSLERASNPLAAEFKMQGDSRPGYQLQAKVQLFREGTSCGAELGRQRALWKVDLHVLLLEDLLVLLQKQDEKLLLKCHSKAAAGAADGKQTFSPVLKLNAVLVRSVATDKRAFFIICTSELGPPQIYELVALTSSDKNTAGLEDEEPEGLPGAGTGPQQRVKGQHPVLPEVPEHAGSMDEEEPGPLPPPPVSLDGENRGGRTRDPIVLPLPGPLLLEGLADSALEDVESLRQLMLWRLLPGHATEPQAAGAPEDDLTPTASASVTSHPWDPGSPGQAPTGDEGDNTQLPGPEGAQAKHGAAAICSLEHLPPRTRHSGVWEPPELDSAPEEEASGSEAARSYQVVRKAEVAGSEAVPKLPESGQSEPEPPGVEGGAEAAGNCFYVSMPAGPPDSSVDAQGAPTDPSPPDSLPAWPAEPRARLREGGGEQRHPGLALSDLGTIFHTIERLTLKLSRLKDMERAHRELLRSLGEESSGGATPVGSFHSEAAGWTDSSLSLPAKGPLPSDCRDSHGAGPCPAEGTSSALEDTSADRAMSPSPRP
ncbi:Rho guanine nucleotide exchange factor 11 [Pteropus alecto]|uniref:Rho guanine nucleotide exchange factor 11 n=1 Tax=Pteropus alecto TaxID=9402 RepID=L5JTP7_PTEAL|nr:Rho guanine nucleotide exchange factor 11 [Pteropus alecto]